MAYTPTIRYAIGQVRLNLADLGITRQPGRTREHGEHRPEPDAPLVLVACSGGRDSLALASVCATVCGTLGVRCGAVIVDHALIAGSAQVAERAAEQCRSFGMDPVIVRRVIVELSGVGVEAAARDARYQALQESARETGAAAVLLAHTRDDQAETVLLGLFRTMGLDALAGMPTTIDRDGVTFSRPFIGLTRGQTTEICRTLDIDWWDDPSNGDRSADEGGLSTDLPLRSRIRNALLPYLIHFVDADLVDHLSRSARIAQRDKDYLDSCAAEAYGRAVRIEQAAEADSAGISVHIDVRELADEHAAIRSRVIARAAADTGIEISSRQVEAIDDLIHDWHGQGGVRLSRGYLAIRQRHVIHLCHDGMHENR
ncbi:tRNA lysidine(34) synthetase TilS [Bifidobacterium simiarum]|uniref:tRNA(Ile)-lysidine synthase n=1 Tax=Bifidobacterium simiarum TaxID=2045441 RepID=A0A2M9HCZ9_9BIFI|nr:tRNA lysidine(34) synthetase TilS [Bifidobacterium simiarum]MBT1167239.1 tRNA lysidine(34) synthetase TilS [Bifidobacterium simiarum]PJM74695.1 tRNA lysidine(34) synthetase TilS [Bifidobacterium simiarum]